MEELMRRVAAKPERLNKSPTKTVAVRLQDLAGPSSSSKSNKQTNKPTAVEDPQKPAVKEKKFSSDDHSSNPETPLSNENNTKELKKPKKLSTRGGVDAGTISVVEETKPVNCTNVGNNLVIRNPQQAVTIKEKQIQTNRTVSCLVFLSFIFFALSRLLDSKEC